MKPGERLYRLLLRAYPGQFRSLYGSEMLAHYRERRAELDRGGRFAGVRFFIEIISDLMRSLTEQWSARLASCRASSRGPGNRGGDALPVRVLRDVRHGIRRLAQRPAFSLTIVATMAMAIGANTAVFSIVNAVLLTPLPYPDADRLVQVFEQNTPLNRFNLSVADYQAVTAQQSSFESFAALAPRAVAVSGGERPEWARAVFATADIFRVLGVPPAEGRGFEPGDDEPGREPVVVLSRAFASRRFGAEVDPMGQALILDGRVFTVVGVMAAGVTELAGRTAELWPVLQLEPPNRRGPFFLRGVGRLRPEVSVAQAREDLDTISQRVFATWAESFQDASARMIPVPLREVIVGQATTPIGIVAAAVAMVLLIAVANIANLMLGDASTRRGEMSLRVALGATRGQLVRLLLTESLVLSMLGGALGLALSVVLLGVGQDLASGIPRMVEVSIDARAAVFAALATLGSGLVFGLAPLLSGPVRGLTGALAIGARSSSPGRSTQTTRNILVALEFALTLPLLVAAALLFSSLLRLQAVDPGFDPRGVVAMQLGLPAATYPDQAELGTFWTEALAAIERLPGVSSVGISSSLPPDNGGDVNNFDLLDQPVEPGQSQPVAPWASVSPDFFTALGVSLTDGRVFDSRDDPDGASVVVVSESWAARYYPDGSALGRQMYAGGCIPCGPSTVVGIVADVKHLGLSGEGVAVYEPAAQYWPRGANMIIRSREGTAAAELLEQEIRHLDADLPLGEVVTMESRIYGSVAAPRQRALLLSIFSAGALLLAAVGIVGVLSYFVDRQQREIGVRMALGADAGAVRRMVVGRGMRWAGAGMGAGLLLSLYTSRWLGSLLFGVTPTDPIILAAVTIALLLVALVACYLPGRRAARIDPIRAIAAD